MLGIFMSNSLIYNFIKNLIPDYEIILDLNNNVLDVTDRYFDEIDINYNHVNEIKNKNLIHLIENTNIEKPNWDEESQIELKKFLERTDSFAWVVMNGILPIKRQRHPALYLFWVHIELINGQKRLRFHNYIKITRQLQDIFQVVFNFETISEKLNDKLSKNEKSLYFASKNLQQIAATLPIVQREGMQLLSETLRPFHRTQKAESNPKTYRQDFKRYISSDYERQIKNCGMDVVDQTYDCIPMTRVTANIIINI